MEFDGPSFYLHFGLTDLAIVPTALEFLRRGPRLDADEANSDVVNTLSIGQFGRSTVSLIWDNEDFLRCFLVVGSTTNSTMTMSLSAEDISSIIAALEQVVADLGSR